MSKDRTTDFTLPKLDDLFSSQEERENGKMPDIKDIPLSLLDEFPNHPFKVRFDDDMIQLIDSVSQRGVLTPALVREKNNGRYEMISGHRRKKASELNQLNSLRCVILDISDEDAAIIMVDSNIQREHILPSEKAFAYKMRLDAMKHQGQRTDLTSVQVAQKSKTSRELLAEQVGDSQDQIRRYIRLTYLVVELLEMVDEGRMKLSPAVELSYLDEDCQRDLVDAIDDELCTPSHAQAIRMHKDFNEGILTREKIYLVMKEEKGNQKPKISIQAEKINKYLPRNVKREQTEDFICKALEHYSRYLERQRLKCAR
ncbi:MAG: ParB/RepB/Spo0J family partition protein [Acetobacter sp.]|nr:ParB/RepB/Spo0J family partition protein [Bacteroides sp.]MCM1341883.1 ParB/RepB/Spo0J family partition protein [Acetobacter sp.]MCM1433180.1 ParB/RepB/Spo0J family partition protein [Clostridiales bacterium]